MQNENDWHYTGKNGGKSQPSAGKGPQSQKPERFAAFRGYCGHCGKWGHRKSECWSAPTESKGKKKGKKEKGGGKGYKCWWRQ